MNEALETDFVISISLIIFLLLGSGILDYLNLTLFKKLMVGNMPSKWDIIKKRTTKEHCEAIITCLLSRQFWIITIFLLVPNLISTRFISAINTVLVNPILSQIPQENYLLSCILILIAILIYIDFNRKWRKNYMVSSNYFTILSIITYWYVYYRFFSHSWYFFEFPIISWFVYADLMVWYCFFTFFLWAKKILQRTNVSKENHKGFISDAPQTSNDSFGRKAFAISLANRIINTVSKGQAFAVGVIGTWGSGKTTFLNFIEKELKDKLEKSQIENIIFLKFNPWQFDNSATLIDDFFSTLKNKLKEFNAELSNQLTNYAQQLIALETNSITKISKIGFNSLSKEKSLDDLFKEINTTLKILNKRIVIFVDDLDRLDKREVIEVIRLIRNTANFSNLIFIVAYDRDYVVNAIKGINDHNVDSYLEKIFQLEIDLPKITNNNTRNYIRLVT